MRQLTAPLPPLLHDEVLRQLWMRNDADERSSAIVRGLPRYRAAAPRAIVSSSIRPLLYPRALTIQELQR
ncbi:MAG TPA: hypothetical protein VIQ60_08695 [Gemmatimonadaceae bacterium]